MLVKLIKYDFNNLIKKMLPLYISVIVLFIIAGIFMPANQAILNQPRGFVSLLFLIVSIISIVIMVVITILSILKRFNDNILGYEGYLTNVLPIKPKYHYLSKLIVSIIFSIFSALVGIISATIIFYIVLYKTGNIHSIKPLIEVVKEIFKLSFYEKSLVTFLYLINVFLGLVLFIERLFLASLIGHQKQSKKEIVEFLSYIILSIFEGFFEVLFAFALGFNYFMIKKNGNFYFYKPSIMIEITCYIIFISLYFAISNYLLEKKLNLE